jgi:glycosyltransferase involved in cell wall biosynthesis
MHILYTAFDVVPSPKGASIHITHFVRGLVQAGHDVHLITAGDPSLPATDSYEGAAITRVPPGDDMNFLVRAIAFGRAVEEHIMTHPPYDVVHYRSIWGGLPLTRLRHRYGYRTLFEVNGLPSVELKYHYPDLRDSPLIHKVREQELATLAHSDAIVSPSDVTRAYLTSLGIPRHKITVIRNGFSPHHFQPTPLPADPASPFTLLYIGTLADWQGLETLIDAMNIVVEQGTSRPIHLRIVGRGRKRQRKQLGKHIRKLGLEEYVTIMAAVPHHDIPRLMAEASVCVAPLGLNDRNVTQGCCPIKVIEYMAAGRPVIATNLPVVRELMREDRDGLLFLPNDPHDLARHIVTLLNDPERAQRMATKAAHHAHATLTWHDSEKKLVRLYEQLTEPVKPVQTAQAVQPIQPAPAHRAQALPQAPDEE